MNFLVVVSGGHRASNRGTGEGCSAVEDYFFGLLFLGFCYWFNHIAIYAKWMTFFNYFDIELLIPIRCDELDSW